MEVKRVSAESSPLDVLDRVLDKGIVIDAWGRLSLADIDLVTVKGRVVVASIATYLQFSEPLGVPAMAGEETRALTCLLCSESIATADRHQHLTGDYHKACFASVAAAGLRVEISEKTAVCALCSDGVASGSIVVRPAHLVVHLACFFTPPRYGRHSLGAAAAGQTLNECSVALRQRSLLLRRMAVCARARAHAVRERHSAWAASA